MILTRTWLGKIKKYITVAGGQTWSPLIIITGKLLEFSNQKYKPGWVTEENWIGKENRPWNAAQKNLRTVSWSVLSWKSHSAVFTQESGEQDRACPRWLEELLTTESCLNKYKSNIQILISDHSHLAFACKGSFLVWQIKTTLVSSCNSPIFLLLSVREPVKCQKQPYLPRHKITTH